MRGGTLFAVLGRLGLGLGLAAFAPSGPVPQPPAVSVTYSIQELDPLPSRIETQFRIAEDGTVVGCYRDGDGKTRAAFWRNGKRADLPSPPEYAEGVATGWTASGDPVGFVFDPSDDRRRRAVLWRNGTPAFLEARRNGAALDAASDRIVGMAETPTGSVAVLWRGAIQTSLGVLDKGDASAANAINAGGRIVGYSNLVPAGKNRACYWENGKIVGLPLRPGGTTAQARAVNADGLIVGWADAPGEGLTATLWQDDKPRDLGTLGDEPSAAQGVNDKGEIVGGSAVNERVYHAFLYRNGKMTDLNSLLPPNSGWTLRIAQSINNKGQIVGLGQIRRERRAFVLTPN